MSVMFQWGPNATTWLIPSELFPTEVRAFAHGISAAAGKLGALAAGLAFAHLTTAQTFWVSGLCGIVGAVVTWLFLPDVSQLDIAELDKLWTCVKSGNASSYSGPASSPDHLSIWEKWVQSPQRGNVSETEELASISIAVPDAVSNVSASTL
jgi:hypothetical protein